MPVFCTSASVVDPRGTEFIICFHDFFLRIYKTKCVLPHNKIKFARKQNMRALKYIGPTTGSRKQNADRLTVY